MSRDASPSTFHERLVEACVGAHGRLALLHTGGLDSFAILLALLEAGHTPDVYTPAFEGYGEGKVRRAHALVERFAPGVTNRRLVVPRSAEALERGARFAIASTPNVISKLVIERATILRVAVEVLAASGYRTFFSAWGNESVWAYDTQSLRTRARAGEEAWRRMRALHVEMQQHPQNTNLRSLAQRLPACASLKLVEPLVEMTPWLLSLSWRDMHHPKAKAIVMRAFPELAQVDHDEEELIGVDGVRRYAEEVAKARGYASPLGFYQAIARETRH